MTCLFLNGDIIPRITPPTGLGKVKGWANIVDALDGEPVFVTRFHVSA